MTTGIVIVTSFVLRHDFPDLGFVMQLILEEEFRETIFFGTPNAFRKCSAVYGRTMTQKIPGCLKRRSIMRALFLSGAVLLIGALIAQQAVVMADRPGPSAAWRFD